MVSAARMKLWLQLTNSTPNAFSASVLAICLFCAVFTTVPSAEQTTDPSDAAALNTLFATWGISAGSAGWNVSGELCSVTAIDSTELINENYNPLIKCDCGFNNGSNCRISRLKVSRKDVFGPIPDALWSLSYLMDLIISFNYLTGQLSPSIGNLTRLKFLSIGVNPLSGQLPKELGLLTDLISLEFGVNYFSGSLPSEILSWETLQNWRDYSAGVSREIPQTFSKLQSLTEFWAADNELNGSIPEFIGNWTKLTALGLWGNNFQGSIPSTFSNLAAIQHLRINGLANGSSSLAFIRNMASLLTLILSNNNFTDTIPSSIINNQQLSLLDLSFNNIYPEIPDSLFISLRSLTDLFLGNNRLTGSLPERKLSSLVNIDLSYNYLSGSFPTWANSMALQLNLVSNNFTTNKSNSVHPSGLECLQRNFPCNRSTGIYSDFAINCGGPQIRSSKNVVFESDLAPLGRATYYMKDTRRWAVSTACYAIDTNTPYIASTSSQITNAVDQELFQTAKLSAGSLRYFGLGHENGNYSLSLQFAESVLVDMANSWKSLGRRRFDVYIQGNRVLRKFDIMKEAGGFASSAVTRDFTALVTENYIEIHLFWDGKRTNRVAEFGYYGPLISAISTIPNFGPIVSNKVPSPKSRKTGMIVGIVVAVVAVLIFSVLAVICIVIRNSGDNVDDEELELLRVNARPYTFTYSELRTATEDFSPANKLGEGGFGSVYKGKLNDGKVIAVKQLSVGSHQGKTQFYAEIAIISAVQHRNLVKLHGCCVDGARRMLVYEYLDNNSLDQAMFGAKSLDLNWQTRLNICMGIARGLAYLHEESRIRIVHRDVKASNILLDAELNPKISDVGLAKLYDDKMTHISTGVAGTIGYLAPEYAMRGHLTEKVDIFGFGVIALEIVSGRPNTATYLEEEKAYLMEWAWELHESDRDLDLVDPRLSEFNVEEVKRVIGIALLCTQTSPATRPAMSRVVAMLLGDAEVNPVLSKPMYLTDWKFTDSSTQMSDILTNSEQKDEVIASEGS